MAFWSRKKAKDAFDVASMCALTPLRYAAFVADFVDDMDPATRAHVAVAYQNLIPWVSALHQTERERGFSFTIEQAIQILNDELEVRRDEINQRRFAWLTFAATIARLEKLARQETAIVPLAATIWTIIATEYPRLKILLPHNIVWTSEEKLWFDLARSDHELIQSCVNHDIPPIFASHEIVEKFADSLGLFYWPQKTRIGFIP